MRQHVGRYGADEGLACDGNGLVCGLERGAPAGPPLRGFGGGGGDGGAHADGFGKRRCTMQAGRALVGLAGHVSRRRSYHFTRRPSRLVDCLRHVEALGEPLPVHPGDRVADLEPRVFDGAGHAVVGARAAEREKVAPRLQHAQDFAPQVDAVGDL